MLLLCDFEKAFDSVSFEFILTSLDIFNFGENFKTWITILLGMEEGKNVNAVTVINGNISTPFKIQQGCRQGDPILGYLFILAIEILALLLKKSKIGPYTTKHGIRHLFYIHAGDLTIYMNRQNSDKKKTMEEFSNTLKNTKNNVAPGGGGFTGSFYKVFWCYIKKIVLGAIHEIFDNKELPISVRLSIIALIPKGDKA